MYVVVAEYMNGENQNILEIVSSIQEGQDVIREHFRNHYSDCRTLEIDGRKGYVSGYSDGSINEAYHIVKPHNS